MEILLAIKRESGQLDFRVYRFPRQSLMVESPPAGVINDIYVPIRPQAQLSSPLRLQHRSI